MPTGYQNLVGEPPTVEDAHRIAKWYHNTFMPSGDSIKYEAGTCRYDATARLAEMVSKRVFENDADRAVLLFTVFVALKCISRICFSIQPIPRKWDEVSLILLQ
ncbi:unnamed protein product [Strongylus vulgaris]|uniref:Uncharacterized protein n=1 Tax=Strongylus vulgaris TaxID=40348 RepID=A0A3P7KQ99_STRVU|nr:unnamed protein product [Strongylus vulgaris]